jgi:hypothetical protein
VALALEVKRSAQPRGSPVDGLDDLRLVELGQCRQPDLSAVVAQPSASTGWAITSPSR